LSDTTS